MSVQKTRNDIIEQALTDAGVLSEDENPTAAQTDDAAIKLDYMVKDIQKTGHLWKEEEATLFLVAGQESYVLGGSNTDNATDSFTETTLSADAAALATTISLTSTTGALASDFIGIKLDDGTLFWTTIVVPATTTITDALPSAATSGNSVFYYTTKIGKPLRVPDARRRQSEQDIQMRKLARIDYLNLPNKGTQGTPVQFYYQPRIDDGKLFLWPTSSSTDQLIKFTHFIAIDVFDTSASAADFPNEWILTLVMNLAVLLAQSNGLPISPRYLTKAEQLMQSSLEWDQEDADIDLQMNYTGR